LLILHSLGPEVVLQFSLNIFTSSIYWVSSIDVSLFADLNNPLWCDDLEEQHLEQLRQAVAPVAIYDGMVTHPRNAGFVGTIMERSIVLRSSCNELRKFVQGRPGSPVKQIVCSIEVTDIFYALMRNVTAISPN
jgi:hypothetical protein